jgi:hypothetical protein
MPVVRVCSVQERWRWASGESEVQNAKGEMVVDRATDNFRGYREVSRSSGRGIVN